MITYTEPFDDNHDAYMHGFADGWRGIEAKPISHHNHYERGHGAALWELKQCRLDALDAERSKAQSTQSTALAKSSGSSHG